MKRSAHFGGMCEPSSDEADLESPAWHETVLAETERRLAEGREEVLDWDQAKAELRRKKVSK